MDKLWLQFVVPGHNKSEIHLQAKDIRLLLFSGSCRSLFGLNEGYRGLFHISKPSVVGGSGRCSRGAPQ